MGFELMPWLFAVAIVGLIWWHAMGARANARRSARAACEDAELRFIDELALKRLRMGRDANGRLGLMRRYGFEFYDTGDRRYAGTVEVHGQTVMRVYMGPRPMRD